MVHDDISDNYNHAASMARDILMLEGYKFETQYVLPSNGGQERVAFPKPVPEVFEEVIVYPNPTSSTDIHITTTNSEGLALTLSLWTIHGKLLLETFLPDSYSTVNLPKSLPHGVYIYHIYRNDIRLKSGRLIVNP